VGTFYIVDSFGALYSEQTQFLLEKYLSYAKSNRKQVGMHAHNNQQLAFANTIEAIICGVNRLDASMYGMGRGAGNCPMELLLSFLKNPKFDIRPLIKVIQEIFIPMKADIEWGYHIPYLVTGVLNEHPRSAMKIMDLDALPDLKKFYEDLKDGTQLD
jgi:4-hydroxy 2-oxovalerate aldolase